MLLIQGGVTEVPELPLIWEEIKCSSWDAGIPKQLEVGLCWQQALPGGRELLSLLWCFLASSVSFYYSRSLLCSSRTVGSFTEELLPGLFPHISEILVSCGLLPMLGFGVGLKGQ